MHSDKDYYKAQSIAQNPQAPREAPAPPAYKLNVLISKVDALASNAQNCADRLSALADRVLGSVPAPAETAGKPLIGQVSSVGCLDASAEQVGRALEAITRGIERLEML